MRTALRIFFVSLILFLYKSNSCFSFGSGDGYVYCKDYLSKIEKEFRLGHYSMVDTLFTNYKATSCYSQDIVLTLQILIIIKNRFIEDNYQLDEAEEIQKEIDLLEKKRQAYYAYHFGIAPSFNLCNSGPPGWSLSAVFGMNSRTLEGYGAGFDLSAGFQRVPFIIDLINNQDNKGNYYKDGYIFKSRGYITFYNLAGMLTVNQYPRKKLNTSWGWGMLLGVEFNKLNTTYIKSYYHEYNYYTDSIFFQDEHAEATIKLSSDYKEDFNDKDFFKTKSLLNILVGFNVMYQSSERFLFTLSPYGCIPTKKLFVNEVDYTKKFNFIEFKLTLSYLFNKQNAAW